MPLVNTVVLVGEIVKPTGCGRVIVIVAEALLDESWTLVAFTVNEPGVGPAV